MVSSPSTVGFIGLGNMGRPMVGNLLDAGYELVVNDLVEDAAAELVGRGAVWGATPRQVAAASDVVFTSLPGPAELESLLTGTDGVLAGARPGSYLVDVSTGSPAHIRRMGDLARSAGVEVLDAPLSGGVRGARKGTLTVMVGGSPEAFEYCEPLFEVIGEFVVHVGPLGAGHVTKLVNNLMGLSNAVSSMEAMAIGVAAGVDPETLLEVVEHGTGSSHMTRTLFPYLILKANFDPVRFSVALAVKDVDLALELADQVGAPVKVAAAVRQALADAADSGLADADISRYITLLEDAVGVEVRSSSGGDGGLDGSTGT